MALPHDDDRGPTKPAYYRESPGLEFDRVAFFSDAVFAIAMTLLVVGIGVPEVSQQELGETLRDKRPEITSFLISFVVIGNYWLAHHGFFHHLGAVSRRLMTLNLVYLAAIAFTPFPTALAGRYTEQPVSIVMYAITLAVASGLEAVMFLTAYREGLLREAISRRMARYYVIAAGIPVLLFLCSIPLAFVDTMLALLSWLLLFPLELLADRIFKPAGADGQLT